MSSNLPSQPSRRLYVVEPYGYEHDVCDIVPASSRHEARRVAVLDGCDFISRRARLFRHGGKPVIAPPDLVRVWTDPRIAPLLREEGYAYALGPDRGWCASCDRNSFECWLRAPSDWAVCGACDLCGSCADYTDPCDSCSPSSTRKEAQC